MSLQSYLSKINERYQTGISREHSYRGDLQNLLEALAPDVLVTNEPARITCGAPDYVITKNDIPVGYIEAKDIGIDLKSKTLKEQFDRYRESLDNLIFTDYIDFHLYIGGEFVTSLAIGEIQNGKIVPIEKNFGRFEALIKDFCTHVSQSIKSSEKLSKMMAGKAKMLALVIAKALESDEQSHQNTELRQQLAAFEQILIHDIKPREFADIYAQTIAYGMFAARLHDPTLDTFSRQEAAELIPKSNPFLRKMFQYVAGYDLDSRIVWIVDALADIFRATDVADLLHDFGKSTQMNDPMIHFYENFLAEYDPKLRKSRGVWYTPEPVVNFIVRAVDDVLKTEFGLKKGLADTSKTKVKVKVPHKATADRRSKTKMVDYEKEVHKVQILDPATGTGTFLAEVVKHIYKTNFSRMKGMWSGYVEKDLIPRLNGFELLMASYAMAHLKLDMLLTETGYKSDKNQRLRIYLTNSLEEAHPDTGTLFANWLSTEASEANTIKRDAPVMVIVGNPPYSGESANKGEWIMELMDDYKKEPEGKVKLKERNPKMINDDYVKFIRYSQHFIEKNGEGVLAFINPHGFLDNPTFRGMRWNLLKTYDKIYTIDLHGNTRRNETSPDGTIDQNVFDIMQGVAISIFIKTGNKKVNELGKVFHYDLYGKRDYKYSFLNKNTLESIQFSNIENKAPNYFMIPKNYQVRDEYSKGFKVNELYQFLSSGVTTSNDSLVCDFSFKELRAKLNNNNINEIIDKDLRILGYKPFDNRSFYLNKEYSLRSRKALIKNYFEGEDNYTLNFRKTAENSDNWQHIFITEFPIEGNFLSARSFSIPLYLHEESKTSLFKETARKPNFNKKIISEIANGLGLTFVPEKEENATTFAPIDVLDYIYAVLHSPTYRETYKEFLKIDFPRVPYPTKDTFWDLVRLGGQLRKVHLLEFDRVSEITEIQDVEVGYPIDGDNIITRKMTKNSAGYVATSDTHGQVWINDDQYFDGVPLVAWEFYIGGYQPAQKWLKDRKNRTLTYEDIEHYCKIIEALSATDVLMEMVDEVLEV